jgi:hypothetical protein
MDRKLLATGNKSVETFFIFLFLRISWSPDYQFPFPIVAKCDGRPPLSKYGIRSSD